jgi:large conductance mechanosensitive channel
MSWAREFKAFVTRGNVVDLAVAFVIGVAFAAFVQSIIDNLISPIVGAAVGGVDFSNRVVTVGGVNLRYGQVLTDLVTFIAVAAAVFFLVVKPVNALIARSRRDEPPDPTEKTCPECRSKIPVDARRCAFCTSELQMA